MNVNDMQADEGTVPCKLTAIFEKQRALMEKYEAIEEANGLLQTKDIPVDIHSRQGQSRLKDFAWRITEELGEATAAVEDHPENTVHFQEEIMDALHFLVEMLILADIGPLDITGCVPGHQEFDALDFICEDIRTHNAVGLIGEPTEAAYNVVHCLARAMNCLKNKPWKTTHMLTDVIKFNGHLSDTFFQMIIFCNYAGMNSQDIYEMYTKKNKVNQFRQQSQY